MTENAKATDFTRNWNAEALKKLPLIAPVRRHTYPMQVPGEEQALARGAFRLLVLPSAGGIFLATCALGFTDPAMPTGLFSCPNPDEMCAVAGGYAYVVDTTHPKQCTHISLKPVVEVRVLMPQRLLLFVGFHSLVAWGEHGLAWQTEKLSWEGLRITEIDGDTLRGFGWNLMTDKEVEFTVDLLTGKHQGGGFTPPPGNQRS
jgi:hypothetical protein